LPREIKRAQRYGRPLSVVLCDIDHFKEINDRFGHRGGDHALIRVTKCLQRALRSGIDWVGRYGGEEFLIVLPETSGRECLGVAERLRQDVADCRIDFQSMQIKVTASFGLSSLKPGTRSASAEMDNLLICADACLYRAKKEGRNRVIAN